MKNTNLQQTVGSLFQQALEKKLTSDLSKKHKDNLRHLYNHFILFLGTDGQEMAIKDLSTSKIEEFLQRYNSSATHYMNKRRDLSVLFNTAAKLVDMTLTTVKKSETRK